jgi:hypothetical protein
MAEVYWAARDLDGPPWGNHQFIAIYLGENEALRQTKAEDEGGTKFVTLGGHVENGNLIFIPNQTADVQSVREAINPSCAGWWSDYDLEKHKIDPPSGGGWYLATQCEELAYKYQTNTKSSPVKYDLWDGNCASWVNTLLKVIGITQTDRSRAGEFNGIDWGEEDLLSEDLFK